VVDLGCGPGNVTAELAARWPNARVVGLDNSEAMVESARADFADVEFVEGEIGDWSASVGGGDWDVVYSNAALHWVEGHECLFPELLDQVAPGGWLAVQMPASFRELSHTVARDIAEQPRWSDKLADALPESPVAEPADYHRWLAPGAASLEVWETTYLHELTGPDPVFQWFRGSWLRPVLARLGSADAASFEAEYCAAVAELYPPDELGQVLMPFRRIFVIATPSV